MVCVARQKEIYASCHQNIRKSIHGQDVIVNITLIQCKICLIHVGFRKRIKYDLIMLNSSLRIPIKLDYV